MMCRFDAVNHSVNQYAYFRLNKPIATETVGDRHTDRQT